MTNKEIKEIKDNMKLKGVSFGTDVKGREMTLFATTFRQPTLHFWCTCNHHDDETMEYACRGCPNFQIAVDKPKCVCGCECSRSVDYPMCDCGWMPGMVNPFCEIHGEND